MRGTRRLAEPAAGLSIETCQARLADVEDPIAAWTRTRLQDVCKQAGIPANQSNVEMARQLTSYMQQKAGIVSLDVKEEILPKSASTESNSLTSRVAHSLKSKVNSLRSVAPTTNLDDSFAIIEASPQVSAETAQRSSPAPSPQIRTNTVCSYPGWPADATCDISNASTLSIEEAEESLAPSSPQFPSTKPAFQIRRVVSKPLDSPTKLDIVSLTSDLTPTSSRIKAAAVFGGMTSTPHPNNATKPLPLSPPAFHFGSPVQPQAAFTFQANDLQNKIMQEMNRRVEAEGGVKVGVSYSRLYPSTSGSQGQEVLKDRYNDAHQAQFAKMDPISASISSKRKFTSANDDEGTIKRSASASSLTDRMVKRFKSNDNTQGKLEGKVVVGLREEGWAEDGALDKTRVKAKDMPLEMLDEVHRRAREREWERRKRRSSVGTRKKAIKQGGFSKAFGKVKAAIGMKESLQAVPSSSSYVNIPNPIYSHPAAVGIEVNGPRFAMATAASVAKVAPSVRTKSRNVSANLQPSFSSSGIANMTSQTSPEKRQAMADSRRSALREAHSNIQARSPIKSNFHSSPRKVRSSSQAQHSVRKTLATAHLGVGRPGWK